MKKRILALFLACCTLFLAVPMFVIAGVAAETESALPETAETAFGPSHADTWPTRSNNVTSNAVDESAIFHGFWQVGYKKNATDFVLLNRYNTTADSKGMLCDSTHNAPWSWGGMYLHKDQERTQPWGQVLVPNYANCKLDVSVRYTAEYTGTVTLEIKDIYFSRANHAIAIFVDGKMVWPNDESAAAENATAYYLDTEKWFADQKTVDRNYGTNNADNAVKTILAGLHINAGSVVEFVDRNTGVADAGESQRGMHSMDFRVTYTAVEARHIQSSIGGRFEIYNDEGAETQDAANIGGHAPLFYSAEKFASKEAYKAYLQTVQKIRFLDEWSVGVVHSSTAEYQPIARRMFFCDRSLTATTNWDAQWGVTEEGYQLGLNSYINSNKAYDPWKRNFGTMYLNWNSMQTTMASTGDTAVAQAYLVPADGYATLSYSSISLNNSMTTKICVMIDGTPVWPAGAVFNDTSTWYTASDAATVNAALATVRPYVRAGERIQFCTNHGEPWPNSAHIDYKPNVSIDLAAGDPGRKVVLYRDAHGLPLARHDVAPGDALPAFPNAYPAATTGADLNGDGMPDALPATVTEDLTARLTNYATVARLKDFLPKVDTSARTVTYCGNWELVAYGPTFAPDGSVFAGVMTNGTLTPTVKEATDHNNSEAAVSTAVCRMDYHHEWGNAGMVSFASGHTVAWRYTAPLTGRVTLGLDDLAVRGGKRSWANYSDNTAFAILVNGEKIWPNSAADIPSDRATLTEDGWVVMQGDPIATADPVNLAGFANLPTELYLVAGDHVEFTMRALNSAGLGSRRANTFFGNVTYTELAAEDSTTVELGATLNDSFGLYFAPAVNHDRITGYEVFASLNEKALTIEEKTGRYYATGVVASDMTAPISYRVVATYVPDGNGVSLHRDIRAGETTFAAVMMEYVTKYRGSENAQEQAIYNLAVATLNYGAAAQERFNAENTTLPNAGLTEEEKAYALTGETAGYDQTENAEAVYTFAGASLLLEDTVKLKVFVNAQDGKTAPDGDVFLEYATNADFTGAQTVKMVQRGNEGDAKSNAALKAALTILPTAYAETYYMRVVQVDESGNATVIGTVLTYSVAAYAARVPAEKELTDRIMTMGEAAEAYLAAMKQA